ncbi:zinc metalloprotease HtpX [Megalodesulfovibrio gigas]|uniref:Protease HtpX homolog n=1 Tax=Megalodesulfovibrio gigas (strain ATCC 19364 / DSM 1382 / NCIMB 9332 / VKM B-1759) TaxID=1121448 RepID=T2GAX4_MEGG1|nr:zinc metalloprotease HtpX [Megalodesulfovibrio gigas]AGW13730.1 putative peptidase M48 Ste24p [Megalodesulfovibrio gigas DSM 1382 = ATCC 19364]
MANQLKTLLLLGLLSGLILFIGGAVGGKGGLIIALFFALIMNVGSYWFSDKLVLRMYRAREVSPSEAPGLHQMVDELAREAGIPKPRVCIIPGDAPNAFATGRNPENGVVAVTEGIVGLLSRDELKAVLAHEIGHIKNRDILVQTVAGVLASVVMFLANMAQWAAIFGSFGSNSDEDSPNPIAGLLLAILAPIAATLIQMAISRSREYLADSTGARLSHNPLALARALEKLSAYNARGGMTSGSEATAHMFIVHPFTGSRVASLFSTHPPTEERVRRLREMAAGR